MSSNHDNIDTDEYSGLGWRFWGGLAGIGALMGIGLMVAVAIFGWAWYAWGFLGAAIALIAVCGGAAWIVDRRSQRRWSSARS